ncbi:UvrD-helicase domain-containing protein [Tardiphaga sp. 768_D3_N2_1]|uniref:UvrD-helicase domain-containing protein n=1 Tax=Tardiphaga sp. 768_D3_N2_1 TaxID=3240783 RepID=UPI003F89DE23
MASADINLLEIKRGTVTAPAGCGKTHLIAQAISAHTDPKPILVLTHTNAGVAALRGRLEKAGVAAKLYRLSTIDGWSMRLVSMFPKRSTCDVACLKLENPKDDYPAIRRGAAILLKGGHIKESLAATYSRLFVDEYQDCSSAQHAIVYFSSQTLPTCVLGDPMQAIFDFAGTLVHWENDVFKYFPSAGELSTPWRWKNEKEESFGLWLLESRKALIAGKPIDLTNAPSNVTWIDVSGKDAHPQRLKACSTLPPDKSGSVLIIGDSTSPPSQQQFASQTPGAITVESVDLKDLVGFAKKFDLKSGRALEEVMSFAQSVMTNVGASDLLRRVDSLKRGTAHKPPTELETAAVEFSNSPSYSGIRQLLGKIGEEGGVRCHRPGILRGCIRALQTTETSEGVTFHEAAISVREQSRALGRPLPRRAVGSTLLLKGLEADVCVVLNADALNRRNLYVAMTRGSRRLVICSAKPILNPTH